MALQFEVRNMPLVITFVGDVDNMKVYNEAAFDAGYDVSIFCAYSLVGLSVMPASAVVCTWKFETTASCRFLRAQHIRGQIEACHVASAFVAPRVLHCNSGLGWQLS
eukprot:SAG31_NODE_2120_length_6405_cov_3.062639_4_plen_107_part_00